MFVAFMNLCKISRRTATALHIYQEAASTLASWRRSLGVMKHIELGGDERKSRWKKINGYFRNLRRSDLFAFTFFWS